MDHGRIVEQGSHEELIDQNGHYALLVTMDLESETDFRLPFSQLETAHMPRI